MWIDPIVEEIRQAREAYAAQFNFDLDAIYEDIKRQERESGREFVSLPPKRVQEEVEGKFLEPVQSGR
jgi:hypothetical protein